MTMGEDGIIPVSLLEYVMIAAMSKTIWENARPHRKSTPGRSFTHLWEACAKWDLSKGDWNAWIASALNLTSSFLVLLRELAEDSRLLQAKREKSWPFLSFNLSSLVFHTGWGSYIWNYKAKLLGMKMVEIEGNGWVHRVRVPIWGERSPRNREREEFPSTG